MEIIHRYGRKMKGTLSLVELHQALHEHEGTPPARLHHGSGSVFHKLHELTCNSVQRHGIRQQHRESPTAPGR